MTTSSKSIRWRVGIVALGLVAAVAVTTAARGDDDARTVTAMFADASPLVPRSEVKMSGVTVGEIESITVQDNLAAVEITLDDSAPTLYSDARAVISAKDLLGERFVSLEPGTPSNPPLPEPAVIDREHTDRQVDLQEVLDTVDDPTGEGLAALVSTLGEGMNGNGENIADAYRALAPAMKRADDLAVLLAEQNTVLGRLIDSTEPVARAVATERGDRLDRLVGSTTTVLEATATENDALATSLQRLPSTIATARRTLARLSGVADTTTLTLSELRPFSSDLPDISAELRRFSEAADPALASLPEVLKKGEKMLDELGPLAKVLEKGGPDLRSITASGRRLSEKALGKRLRDLMEFVRGWSLSTSSYDALSHYFRAMVPVSPKALAQAAGGAVPGAPRPKESGPVDPTGEADAPLLDLPGLEDLLDLGGLLGGLTGGGARDRESATGLSADQERSLLGQILGGGS